MKETILVTGAAGFIGFNLCEKLIKDDFEVIGLDNINSYYDENLKLTRLEELKKINGSFIFYREDIEKIKNLEAIFLKHKPTKVFNLAAQAGVRYSIKNPNAFLKTNIIGFGNILECCRKNRVDHLIYASSSSVYGGNIQLPYSEKNTVDHPVSLYAATKKSNELMAHTYSHLYSLPSTGLRFFTVYGPWGRPDMAYFLFTKSIIENKSIDIFNFGDMQRDFTYIDDIIESLIRIMNKPPTFNKDFDKKNPEIYSSWAPHKIFNIGNSNTIPLMEFIENLEEALGMKAIKNFVPFQPGDVKSTFADTTLLEKWINYKPNTSIKEGIFKFVDWFRYYYNS